MLVNIHIGQDMAKNIFGWTFKNFFKFFIPPQSAGMLTRQHHVVAADLSPANP